ncbi:MAG: TIM barrel protein [Gemmatimonadota bacterium]
MTTRRELLGMAGMGALGLSPVVHGLTSLSSAPRPVAGRLKQSVCRWPFAGTPDNTFFPMVKALGFGAVDLLKENEWPLAEEQGLICSMGTPTDRHDFIQRGLNDPANHPLLIGELERTIAAARQHGVPNVIAMIGNRYGRSDEAGLAACVEALDRVKGQAEAAGVTICLELLNSRVDHHDFMGDRMSFGLALMYAVNSPRVRLLYDIYHMQIMEGDLIRTIRDHGQWIAHYHTAGNPGRNELDPSQELNYRGIAQAIADTGFGGWIAHEFIPTRDPAIGLAEARETCLIA